MKKKIITSIALVVSFLLLTVCTVYAAFKMTNSYNANGNFHEINEQSLTFTDNAAAAIEFKNPGDISEIKYSISSVNTNKEIYSYSFRLDGGANLAYDRLFDMVYIYQQNEMIGVLSDYLTYTKPNPTTQADDLHIGKPLPLKRFICPSEAHDNVIKLELHNASPSFNSTKKLDLVLECAVSTINYQTELYANNVDDLNRALDDITDAVNLDVEKTLYIGANMTLSKAYTIGNSFTIDLLGHNLTLGAALTISNNIAPQTVTIKDSVGGGLITTPANLVLNGSQSFIKPMIDITGFAATQFDTNALKESLDRELNNNFITTDSYKLLGFYSAYIGKNGVSLFVDNQSSNGVYNRGSLATNKVINVDLKANAEILSTYSFTVLGNDASVITTIKNEVLGHLLPMETLDNTYILMHDVFLPTSLKEYNATISWHSSNENVITRDGILKNVGQVVLTGTIKLYGDEYSVRYYANVQKQTNADKLKYLATKVESFINLTNVKEMTAKNPAGSFYDLPVAFDKNNPNYYTKWTKDDTGKVIDLGITNIDYDVESTYYYISVDKAYEASPNQDCLKSAYVYLNQHTYEKNARIRIKGSFGNEIEYTFINIKITLTESQLQEKIYQDVQDHLNSVDVLANILKTRRENGIANERGDFELVSSLYGVTLSYEAGNKPKDQASADAYELYKIELRNGVPWVVFKDLTQLKIKDTLVPITVNINVASGNTTVEKRVLYFKVPGAITDKNFTNTKENLINFDLDIFSTVKYQTLMQIDDTYTLDGTVATTLSKLTNSDYANKFKTLNKYILVNDALQAEKLVFELGNNKVILDSYDLSVLETVLNWAVDTTGAKTLVEFNGESIKDYVSNDLLWIKSDGTADLSDGEIELIRDYCQKFAGASSELDTMIDIKDNVLTDADINKILATLSSDKGIVGLLTWMTLEKSALLSEYLNIATSQEVIDNYYKEYVRPTIETKVNNLDSKTFPNEAKAERNAIDIAIKTPTEMPLYVQYFIKEEIKKDPDYSNRLNNNPAEVDTIFGEIIKQPNTNKLNDYATNIKNKITFKKGTALADKKKALIEFRVDKETYNVTAAERKVKYDLDNPNNIESILNTKNDSSKFISNEEERAIVYYVQSVLPDKYVDFYNVWSKAVSRKDIIIDPNNGPDKGTKGQEITAVTSGTVGTVSCSDVNFRGLIAWITEYKSSTQLQTHLPTRANNIFANYLSMNSEHIAFHGDYDIITTNEWNVLKYYLDLFDFSKCKNQTFVITDFITYMETNKDKLKNYYDQNPVDLNSQYLTKVTAYGAVTDWHTRYGFQLNKEVYENIAKMLNEIYENAETNTKTTNFNNLLAWATNNTFNNKIVDWYSQIKEEIPGVSHGLISDFKNTISYDEYIVLYNYYEKNFIPSIASSPIIKPTSDVVRDFYKNYYWDGYLNNDNTDLIKGGLNLNFTENTLNTGDITKILQIISPSTKSIEGVINNIRSIYRGTTPPADGYDHLSTVGKDELNKLVNEVMNNKELTQEQKNNFIAELNKVITTYTITLNTDNSIVITDKANRRFDKQEYINRIKALLGLDLQTLSYKYIPVLQINNLQIETIKIIRVYENLSELVFRGNSQNDLFANSDNANQTFLIVSSIARGIKKLTFAYSALSSIKGVENLSNLKHLDVRGNKSKTNVKYLTDISPLLNLLEYVNFTMDYLNVSNIDTLFKKGDLILNKLYNRNKNIKIYYTVDNMTILFKQSVTAEEIERNNLLELASLLHEIEILPGNLLVLPKNIYGNNNLVGNISWYIYSGSEYASLANNILVVNLRGNDITIAADITLAGSTVGILVTRYFIIKIPA